MKSLIITFILTIVPTAALAASTTTTYNSGILVLGFFALCALIIVVQLIPAIMMVAGALKAMFSRQTKHAEQKL